ncbi:Beta-galactosidase-1-like protein [Desmophyllum pertusum]|uniref:Beta-galactosidase n=1 Tax=Desmophyllum pertusum TaxID=174260 RepID=A0A9X0CV86_9CNID|nr:Beta-galactosidase-1-like protein [Desmophyllum pertusum]
MAAVALKVLLTFFAFLCALHFSESRSFVIDYENDCFLKDGEPFRYISGCFHYFRVPRFYWKDRLMKMKAGGLNTVQTYIAWNIHEPVHGTYNFDGDADIVSFIELANSLGLLVIVRAGPYICAEWEFGGYPPWLLKNTSIILRSMDNPMYTTYVQSWMSVLLPKLKPLLYVNGGPIISVQVENEYGSFFACDHDYMKFLEQLFREYLGNDIILFTVDGDSEAELKCGTIPSLYATVDFGDTTDPEAAFAIMRKFSPKGPLVNTEFYPGWLDLWGVPHQTRPASTVAETLDKILSMNASVNFYMYEGGTNFGFMNGAGYNKSDGTLIPSITSYDYDAPLTEAGDTTTKFQILQKTIAKHEKSPVIPVPANTTKFAYGKVQMTRQSTLLNVLEKLSPDGPVNAPLPLTMEQIGQNYGFILYRTQIPQYFYASGSADLNVSGVVRDRAIIYVGNVRQGTTFRHTGDLIVPVIIGHFLQLDILVENMGRLNQGMADPKGILGNVTLNGTLLMNWQMYAINLDNLFSDAFAFAPNSDERKEELSDMDNDFAPSFFYGEFPVNSSSDTFLQLPGWHKGQAFVNGFNLGRYWPVVGPQNTLFVPASVLSVSQNPASVLLFELDFAPCEFPDPCFVEFVSTPSLDGPVHPFDEDDIEA